ncbi:hypothetical protein PAMC26577_39285 [Caballeronia sordidicola]|uniref:Uncharacterized protein n=1 Tax=Caballeronia sordidicola TaxID=196367 RepID=A0A242M453_CABSO|nr:hypothetical protein PAMC26577_39285 [Caballeronia sordidicola]
MAKTGRDFTAECPTEVIEKVIRQSASDVLCDEGYHQI